MRIIMYLAAVCFGLVLGAFNASAQRQYEFVNMRPASPEAKIAYDNGVGYFSRLEKKTGKDESKILQLFEAQIADFSKIIEIEPGFAPGYYLRGNAYYERAKFRTKTVSAKDPNVSKDTTAAIEDLSQAIALASNYGNAILIRAMVYRFVNRREDALSDWDKYTEIHKREKAGGELNGYSSRIYILTEMQQYARALAETDIAIEYFSNPISLSALSGIYHLRAQTYQAKGDTVNRDKAQLKAQELMRTANEQHKKSLETQRQQ